MLGILLLMSSAYGLEECLREQDPSALPCLIISSWKPASCNVNISFFNESGYLLGNISFVNGTPFCEATFNFTDLGTYIYNSSIDSGVITVGGGNMWLIAILLIPLGLSFLFVHWGNSLNEDQEPLKWFMRLLSLLMIFALAGAANIVIQLNPAYAGLEAIFDMTVITWIFYTVTAVLLIYLIYKIFISFKEKQSDDLERGFLK